MLAAPGHRADLHRRRPDHGQLRALHDPGHAGADDALGAKQISVLLYDGHGDRIREQHYVRPCSPAGGRIIVAGRTTDPRPWIGRQLPIPTIYTRARSSDPETSRCSTTTGRVRRSLAIEHSPDHPPVADRAHHRPGTPSRRPGAGGGAGRPSPRPPRPRRRRAADGRWSRTLGTGHGQHAGTTRSTFATASSAQRSDRRGVADTLRGRPLVPEEVRHRRRRQLEEFMAKVRVRR